MTLKPAAEAARLFMLRDRGHDEHGCALESDIAELAELIDSFADAHARTREDAVREECAEVAELYTLKDNYVFDLEERHGLLLAQAKVIAKAIRARGGPHEATIPNAET